jgi:hypothetical protein
MTTALAKATSAELARLLRSAGIAYNMRDVADVDTAGIYWQWPSLASGLRRTPKGVLPMNYWATGNIRSIDDFINWYNNTVRELVRQKPANWRPDRLTYESKAFPMGSARLFYSQPVGWPHHTDDAAFQFAVEAVYHLKHARPDIEVIVRDGGIAAYYHKLPIAGVRREGVLINGNTTYLGNTPVLSHVTDSPRGHAVDSEDSSLIARTKVHLQGLLTRAPYEITQQVEDLLDMMRFYTHGKSGPAETFLVMLSAECAHTAGLLQERDNLKQVIDQWETLAPTDLQRFGQAMLRLCPRPLSPTVFNARILNIVKQAGKEPTTEQAFRGYSNLQEFFHTHCQHYGIPEE